MSITEQATTTAPEVVATSTAAPQPTVAVRRHTIDIVLVSVGVVLTIVLAVAGVLLQWGANFANDHVRTELTSQQIFFPDKDALTTEGRTDLLGFAGQQVANGDQANAYASYIAHHLDGIADGQTYAQLGTPERAAKAAVQAAKDGGAPQSQIDDLQAKASALTGQRDTLFKGETLRGLLLTTYAWSTIGEIAGIAAICAFVAAGIMLVLVIFGIVHLARVKR
jgi:hypothetical protein